MPAVHPQQTFGRSACRLGPDVRFRPKADSRNVRFRASKRETSGYRARQLSALGLEVVGQHALLGAVGALARLHPVVAEAKLTAIGALWQGNFKGLRADKTFALRTTG
jgi:hypothetical protein